MICEIITWVYLVNDKIKVHILHWGEIALHYWLKDFLRLFYENKEQAWKLKHQFIPEKLYKYQPISEQRINSLKENKLWFCKSTELNDPFDCQPTFFNEKELLDEIIKTERPNKLTVSDEDILKWIKQLLLDFKSSVNVTCFSETPYNMPMWGNYANNHRGICVEYDFNQLEYFNEFTKNMFPVGYEENRYDITNLLKRLLTRKYDPKLSLFFFLLMLKHNSWEYEREWRVLDMDIDEGLGLGKISGNGRLLDCPVQPSAIYFGMNCSDTDIEEISTFIDPKQTKLYKLNIGNHKYFNLDIIQ